MADEPDRSPIDRTTVTERDMRDQLKGARRIAAGIWLDRHGDLHFSVPELLALVALEDTPANRAAVVETLVQVHRKHLQPGGRVILQELES